MLLYGWDGFCHNPLVLFEIWDGGMVSHGGFAGVTLALIWVAWLKVGGWLKDLEEQCRLLRECNNAAVAVQSRMDGCYAIKTDLPSP